MTTTYSVGTVTVANGGTTVTGVGTSWIGKVFEGDLFTDPAQGIFARVTADATSNTALTINAWPGVGMTADPYEVLLQQDSIRMSERMRQYVELAGAVANTGIGVDAFGLFADRIGYDDAVADFAFLSLDGDGAAITTAVVFIKASSDVADWSGAIPVQGDKGDQGEPGLGDWKGPWVTATAYALDDIVEHDGSSYICVIAHNSGTFATDLAAAKWDLVVEKGDVGIQIEGDYSGATAYGKGDVVQNAGSSWVALQSTTGNAPPTLPTTSNAYWQLLARKGTDGAGTVSSIVAGDGIEVDDADPTAPVISAVGGLPVQGRLSLTSGVSVTESDVVGATAVYLVPDGLNRFPIYDGTVWQNRPLAEMTLTLNATAHPVGNGFDVWVAWQSSAMIIGTGPAWSSVTAGASSRGAGAGTTEIELFEGRIVNKNAIVLKNGATTYASIPARQATLVGGFMTVAAGQTSDSKADRLLWNVNGVKRLAQGPDEVTSTWAYSTAAYRQANGNAANKFRAFQGLGGRMVTVEACSFVTNSTTTKRYIVVGVGINSTTVNSITAAGGGIGAADNGGVFVRGTYRGYPALGLNEFIWLENGGGTDTQTWFGVQAKFAPGIVGEVFL